jgi:methionine-rich copper-binding protein CopC
MRRTLFALVLALLLAPATLAAAQAPQPSRSDPEPGERLHKAPDRVRILFDAPLDAASEVTVYDSCAEAISGGSSVNGGELSTRIGERSKGHHTVRYSADGAGDAPSTGGTYSFYVHAGPSCRDDHAHRAGKKAGDEKPGAVKAERLQARDRSSLQDRMSPQLSLVLVLLGPALVGLIGGLTLRRRSSR